MITAKVTYTIKDADGDPGYFIIHLSYEPENLESYDDPDAYARIIGGYLAQAINGKLTNITISHSISLPDEAIEAVMSPLADVQEQLTISVRTNGGFPSRMTIPTIKESAFLPSGEVDMNQPEVADLLIALLQPEDALPTIFTASQLSDARGDFIGVQAWRGLEAWGKRRT